MPSSYWNIWNSWDWLWAQSSSRDIVRYDSKAHSDAVFMDSLAGRILKFHQKLSLHNFTATYGVNDIFFFLQLESGDYLFKGYLTDKTVPIGVSLVYHLQQVLFTYFPTHLYISKCLHLMTFRSSFLESIVLPKAL